MVGQVVDSGWREKSRKPLPQMNTPVEFFESYKINRKCGRHAGNDPESRKPLNRQRCKTVEHKQRDDPERRLAEREMFGFLRRAGGHVIDQMSPSEKPHGRMQEETVIDVLKTVCPNQSGKKPPERVFGRRRP